MAPSRRKRLAMAGILLLCLKTRQQNEPKKVRSVWVKESLQKRSVFGIEENLLVDLLNEGGDGYRNFLRMDFSAFEMLHHLVSPHISKEITQLRSSISSQLQLAVTLRFLATGDSYKSLEFLTRISASTISLFIPRVCELLFELLKAEYMKCVVDVFSICKRHTGHTETEIRVTPFQLHKLQYGPKEVVSLTRNDGLQIYEKLRMIRCLEVRATELYRAQFVRGFCHLYLGQEACCVGLRLAMRPNDSIITAYRCHGWAYVMGLTPHEVLAEMTGRTTGAVRGKGGSMHMFCPQFYGGNAIIGAHVPVGTGIAFAYKYRGEDGMCFACYGDGAANQGRVFEAYNIAKLWDLPIVFVCENNLYAMGTASAKSSANPKFYTRCEYIPGIWVDGMDVLAVREAGRFAVEWCSSGKGPLVYELHTYRYSGHSVSDPGTTYRTREEVKKVRRSRDPIELFKMHLLSSELATEEDIMEIDNKAKDTMDKAAVKATEDPEPDLKELAGDLHFKPAEKFARGVGPWDKFEVKSFNTPMQTLP